VRDPWMVFDGSAIGRYRAGFHKLLGEYNVLFATGSKPCNAHRQRRFITIHMSACAIYPERL
jgi:hypothetical protein